MQPQQQLEQDSITPEINRSNRANKTDSETNHQYDPPLLIIHIKRKQDALSKPELIS